MNKKKKTGKTECRKKIKWNSENNKWIWKVPTTVMYAGRVFGWGNGRAHSRYRLINWSLTSEWETKTRTSYRGALSNFTHQAHFFFHIEQKRNTRPEKTLNCIITDIRIRLGLHYRKQSGVKVEHVTHAVVAGAGHGVDCPAELRCGRSGVHKCFWERSKERRGSAQHAQSYVSSSWRDVLWKYYSAFYPRLIYISAKPTLTTQIQMM